MYVDDACLEVTHESALVAASIVADDTTCIARHFEYQLQLEVSVTKSVPVASSFHIAKLATRLCNARTLAAWSPIMEVACGER